MCFVLYLGSEKQLPLIAWDAEARRFHVTKECRKEKDVSRHLRKHNIYYVGSDNGCGCGFRQAPEYPFDDPSQLASKLDNHARLHEYVSKCLETEATIELYSCWDGDEHLPSVDDRTVRIADLMLDEFWFAERQRTTIIRT